jgi:hypothetical protein
MFLVKISSNLQLLDHSTIHKSLQKDEDDIYDFLCMILSSEVDMEKILQLQGEDAQCFLDVIQSVSQF